MIGFHAVTDAHIKEYVCLLQKDESIQKLDIHLNIKVACCGYGNVCKSAIVIQYVSGQYVDPTIENSFRKQVKYAEQTVTMNIIRHFRSRRVQRFVNCANYLFTRFIYHRIQRITCEGVIGN